MSKKIPDRPKEVATPSREIPRHVLENVVDPEILDFLRSYKEIKDPVKRKFLLELLLEISGV